MASSLPDQKVIAAAGTPAKRVYSFTQADVFRRPTPKLIFTYYGGKGTGKTVRSFDHPGRILCLSFDNKSESIKAGFYKDDPRIFVVDAVQFYDDTTEDQMTSSADKSVAYILWLLREGWKVPEVNAGWNGQRPHWVVFDGAEVMEQIAEQKMRFNHNLKPYEGIANLNLWKDRAATFNSMYRTGLSLSIAGVIFTTYTALREIVPEGGSVPVKKEVPKWMGSMEKETDYSMFCEAEYYPTAKRMMFTVRVQSAKHEELNILKTAQTFDVSAGKKTPFGPDLPRWIERAEKGEWAASVLQPSPAAPPPADPKPIPSSQAVPTSPDRAPAADIGDIEI